MCKKCPGGPYQGGIECTKCNTDGHVALWNTGVEENLCPTCADDPKFERLMAKQYARDCRPGKSARRAKNALRIRLKKTAKGWTINRK